MKQTHVAGIKYNFTILHGKAHFCHNAMATTAGPREWKKRTNRKKELTFFVAYAVIMSLKLFFACLELYISS